ncbi:MAG: heavy metal translocating P-type ATPase metal-binding domain-containing protein [Holophagales bacterium]|nr:MAG: heavy metal translocating P-type ATPase metal-binding domain-containing protein [Holophagales bacterium]
MTVVRERPASAAPVLCAHCGLAVPASLVRDGEAEQFCCSGCRQVYTLVREWGFDQYYRLVERQGARVEPAQVSGRSFADFDDLREQQAASESLGAERCRTRLYLEGVHCAACVWLVEKLPAVLHGVEEVRLNLGSGVAEITWRPGDIRLSAVGRALDRLGYTPHVHRAARSQDARRAEDRRALARLGVATACAMNLMFLHGALYAGDASGMAASYEAFFRWCSLVVATPVLLFAARPFFVTAIAGLRARLVHIDLPIALALAVAFVASSWNVVRGSGPLWFDSLAMLTAALLGARQLQRGAQRAALERADSLRGVAFLEFARRLEGDGIDAPAVEVPLAVLAPGDRVEVRSGELVPVDGVVLGGRSALDNAVLTGESAAVAVREGDFVNAGATNLGARLVVRVEAAGERTRVGALLTLVDEALSRKPKLLQITDRLARRFVMVLLAASVATGIGWWALGPEIALERVVALLVVACPCALGLSVPLAVSVALLRAARAGIFVKNPDALERLREVGTVLLDKTGTLTEGRATVARWSGDDVVLELARALENESSHAVARAFRGAAARPLRAVRAVADVVEAPGKGISGSVDAHRVAVGSRTHMDEVGAIVPATAVAAADGMVAERLSPVFVAVDGVVGGVAGIGDALRADARTTVDALRARGIRVRILSGDHAEVVARVGAELGLAPADALGGLTPEVKRDLVAAQVAESRGRGHVVMVGDGVNDAAALALADVGVAVHGGTGATLVAADVVLTREGVAPVLDLLDGARRVRRVVRRNLGFSLVYNAGASALAIAGMVGPLLAAVLMPISSLAVVLSSAFGRSFAIRSRGQAARLVPPAGAEA